MSIVKQNIMDSAVRFFSEKGYLLTSIQEIADDCGIAKGSLYKFFPSKEELFLEVHLDRQIAFFGEMKEIQLDPTLTTHEMFIRMTECQINFFVRNKFILDIKKMNTNERKIPPFLMRLRANVLNMNKEALIRRFGKEIEPYIWDLVVIYSGIIHEYLFLLLFEQRPLNTRVLAEFITDRIEDVITNLMSKKPQPVVVNSIMQEYIHSAGEDNSVTAAEQRNKLIEQLSSTVKELAVTNYRRTELHEAIELLHQELAQDQPKTVLIRALFHFLDEVHELRGSIGQLEKLILRN